VGAPSILIPRIYVAKRNEGFFRRLMPLVSSSIFSTYEDMFSYPNVLMNYFLKL
jgi:hypothetical protein